MMPCIMAIIGEIYFKIGMSSTLNPYTQKNKTQIPDSPESKFALFHFSTLNRHYFDKHFLIKTFWREVKIKVWLLVNIE